jgi:chaperonin GroEL (HSP60 family)
MSEAIEETGLPQEKDVQRDNIQVAKTICDILKKSLGPTGTKKLLVDSLGYYVVSSDGAKMLESMSLWHPVAKILINMAVVQKKILGDGSISVVILASELLKRAGVLMDQGVHPTKITSGYEKASKKAEEILDEIAVRADVTDRKTLKRVAYTSLSSKFDETDSSVLADMAVDAIEQIAALNTVPSFDIDQIHIVKKSSGSIADSRMTKGVVIDETVVHSEMPKHVKKARIAVLACPLEIEKFEHLPPSMKSEILITAPGQMKSFVDQEYSTREKWVDRIRSSGANVVVCEKRIDDYVKYLLAKQGIMAITLWRFSAKDTYLVRIAKACGAEIVRSLQDLKEEDLGFAEFVEEREVGTGKVVFVEGCRNPMSISLMIRGVSKEFVDDAERAVIGALHSLASLFQCNRIVAGGGSVQLEMKKRISDFSLEFGGKEQLAISAFGDALGSIPETLVGNVGLNRLDVLPLLVSKHHKPGSMWQGFDVLQRKSADMMEAGVVEPLLVSRQAIKSASETAIMILRADAIIAKRTVEERSIPEDAPGRKLPGFLPASHMPEFKDWEKQHTVF